MDEVLGESPFEIAGESSFESSEFVNSAFEHSETAYREAAESRLDELEAQLGESPWTGERELPPSGPSGPPARGPLAIDTRSCPDVTDHGEPWNRGRVGRHQTATGTATQTKIAESAAVRRLELGDFDVDDYRLRPAHRSILGVHVAGIADALRRGRIVAPVVIHVVGRTSSSGSMAHNLALSRHRAVNTATMIVRLAHQAGIAAQLEVDWTPLGESISQIREGDNVESAGSRQVEVQVIAPRPVGFRVPIRPASMRGEFMSEASMSGDSEARYGNLPRQHGYRPTSRSGNGGRRGPSYASGEPGPASYRPASMGPVAMGPIGMAAANIGSMSMGSAGAPRFSPTGTRLCFEVVSLRRSPHFAWLRVRGLRTVTARVRVHEHGSRNSAMYVLQGVLLRSNRAPASASAVPLARLTRLARRILGIAMRAPNPRRGCSPAPVIVGGGSATRRLSGMAMLVIPPAGSGPALLRLSPRPEAVRLRRRLVSVRARRYAAPMMIVGRFRLLAVGVPVGGRGETGEVSEYGELGENEWNEAEYGELGENAWNEASEYGELGESEWTETDEVNEYGELGETELGEAAYGEQNEYGEAESEWAEAGEMNEYGELGEGEWNEAEYNEQNEYGEAESEWAELGESESESESEFEFSGASNESGEQGEYGEADSSTR